MSDEPKRRLFKAKDLRLIASAESFNPPGTLPFRMGDIVVANSGGPNMLVVDDSDTERVTCAWRQPDGSSSEADWPRPCVHRIDPVA